MRRQILSGIQDCMVLGKLMHASGDYRRKNEAALICDCIEAFEQDWDPFFVARESQVVEGKRQWSAFGHAAIAKRFGYEFKTVKLDDTGCTLQLYFQGTLVDTASFTAEQARIAQLNTKANYEKYGEDMYFARAVARICRRNCHEAFNGSTYALGETIAEADAVEGDARPELPSPDAPQLGWNEAAKALPEPDAVVATVADATVALYASKSATEIKQFVENHGVALTAEQKKTLRDAFKEARDAEKKAKEAKAALKQQVAALQTDATETEQPTETDESTTLPTSEMPAPA